MSYPRSTEQRILRAIPFLLLGGITLGMSLVGYDGYKRTHAKPSEPVGNPGTFWIRCNAGMEVKYLRDCPENKYPNVSYVPDSGPLVITGYGADEYGGGDTVTFTFTVAPRKHKRKVAPETLTPTVVHCPDGTLTSGTCPTTDANGITWLPGGGMVCLGDEPCPVPTPADIEAHKVQQSRK